MTTKDSYDAIVIGAGVIGCAVARELASDHDVLVLDRGQVAGETTAKASGLMTIVPDLPDSPDLARYAVEFFRDYDGTGHFSFTPRPSIQLVTADEEEWARERAAKIASNGFEARYLDVEEIEDQYPDAFVLDEFVGAIEFGDTGWVDPYTYATTLQTDAEERGVQFETGVTVEAVTAADGSITGVVTDEGTVEAPNVVCAAGWRTRELVADFVAIPVRPFRWQTVNLAVDRDLTDYPIAWESVTGIYWRPEHNGDLHVGGGTYFVENSGDRREGVTESFRTLVATEIGNRVRDVADARIVAEDCCSTGDAATPDNRPIVDAPPEAPDGLTIATGCPIGGIMTSPSVARAVRSLVTGDPCPFSPEAFALDRFESRSTDFDCSYVYGTSAPETYT